MNTAAPDRRPQYRGPGRIMWTDERIAALQTLWAQGIPARAIGEQLGVTKNSVIGKAHRLGLEQRQGVASQRRPKPAPVPRPVWKVEVVQRPVPAAPAPAPAFLGIPLVALTPWQCRYPKGDEGFVFCGQPRRDGSSYCEKHHTACHNNIRR